MIFYFKKNFFWGPKRQKIKNAWVDCLIRRTMCIKKMISKICRINKSRFMPKKPKLIKTVFWFFYHERSIFIIFLKTEKSSILYSFIPFLYMSHNNLALKGLPRRISVRFLPKKGSLIFEIEKKRLTTHNHLSKGFQKKGKYIWNRFARSIRWGGVLRFYTVLRPYMYICMSFESIKKLFRTFWSYSRWKHFKFNQFHSGIFTNTVSYRSKCYGEHDTGYMKSATADLDYQLHHTLAAIPHAITKAR